MIKLVILLISLFLLSTDVNAIDFKGRIFEDPLKKLSCEVREGVPWQKPEWYRIFGDFNNDGLDDLAISTSTSLFGTAGGWFDIYIQTNDGRYKYLGDLPSHPAAINVKPVAQGETLVTTYHHSSASSGALVRQKITSDGIEDISNAEISPGTNEKDRLLYETLFNSHGNLKIQKSFCEDNQVQWRESE